MQHYFQTLYCYYFGYFVYSKESLGAQSAFNSSCPVLPEGAQQDTAAGSLAQASCAWEQCCGSPRSVCGRAPQGLPTLWMENQGGGICWLWWLCSQPRAGSAAMSPEREPRQEEGGKGLEEEGCLIHLQVKGKGWGNGARGDHEHTRGVLWLPSPCQGTGWAPPGSSC